jgi:hypothetical protein
MRDKVLVNSTYVVVLANVRWIFFCSKGELNFYSLPCRLYVCNGLLLSFKGG